MIIALVMSGTGADTPRSVVRRLARYYAVVQDLRRDGVDWVSSQEMAEALELTSSTVRQDLSHLDFSGISKRGYETFGLEEALATVLGADVTWNMVVVGAGNLGCALTRLEEFQRKGFRICGVFDTDTKKIGKRVGQLSVQGMYELPGVVRTRQAQIGVIAVPAAAAQGVADILVAAGVQGLLNLAMAHITVPKDIAVVHERIVEGLHELCHAIRAEAP